MANSGPHESLALNFEHINLAHWPAVRAWLAGRRAPLDLAALAGLLKAFGSPPRLAVRGWDPARKAALVQGLAGHGVRLAALADAPAGAAAQPGVLVLQPLPPGTRAPMWHQAVFTNDTVKALWVLLPAVQRVREPV